MEVSLMKAAGAIAAIAAVAAVVVAPAHADTFTVANLDDMGSGSLRQAVLDANATPGADTIVFGVSGTITLTSGELLVTDSLTIDGPGAASLTISGNNASRVLTVGSSSVALTVEGLTVANGAAGGGDGGGIHSYDGTLTVANSIFSGNSAEYGGAINNFGGTVAVANTIFSGNSASSSGGGINSYGAATVSNSVFTGNSAARGSGGGIAGGPLTVTDSTFTGNSVPGGNGGGVANGGVATVTNSTFSGNSAEAGGGISNGGSLALTNSTLAGNAAGFFGGGAIWNSGTLTATNSTLSGNSAGDLGGGGILNWPSGADTPHLRNTIVANNSDGNCSGTMIDEGGNLQYPGTDCGGSITSADPLLDPAGLQDNGGPTKTIALQPASPAIDTAVLATCPPTDQRGVSRPQGAGCDVGAFELNALTVAIDIKPGGFPNSINVSKKGTIPVAVLGTPTFDPADVDPGTVCFGDAEEPDQRDCSIASMPVMEDVNGDGILDLVLRFETPETGIDLGDTQACLTGQTFGGVSIEGCDSVKVK